MRRLSKSLTKGKPVRYGSIRSTGITEMEKIEYRQTGMIKVKETPVSRGEINRLRYGDIGYYDYIDDNSGKWFEDIIFGLDG